MEINPIKKIDLSIETPLLKGGIEFNESQQSPTFSEMFNNSINNLDDLNKTTKTAIADYTSGRKSDVHEVMMTMEKSSMAMNLALQVRNRMVEAYHEINRMQF